MKDGKKNTVLLTIIGIATLLVAVVGATFAYFSAVANGNATASTIKVTSGNNGNIVIPGPTTIDVTNVYPRANAWVTKIVSLTYTNTTGTSGNYTYHFNIEYTNNFAAGSLAYNFLDGSCSKNTNLNSSNCTAAGGTYDTTTKMCSINSAENSTSCAAQGGTWTANSTTNGTPITAVTTSQPFATGSGSVSTLSNGSFKIPTAAGGVTQTYTLNIFFPDTGVAQNTEQGKTFTAYVKFAEVQ